MAAQRKLTAPQRALLDSLVGNAEIVEMTGASKGLVSMWQKRAGFPEPVITLSAGRFYLREDVQSWYDARSKTDDEAVSDA